MSFIHSYKGFQSSSPDNANLICFRDPAQLLREEIDELSKVQPLPFNLMSKLELCLTSCIDASPISHDMRSVQTTWNQCKTEGVLRCLVLRNFTPDDPGPNPYIWTLPQKKYLIFFSRPGQPGTEGGGERTGVWAWGSWLLESNSAQKEEAHQEADTGHHDNKCYVWWGFWMAIGDSEWPLAIQQSASSLAIYTTIYHSK